MPAELRVSGLDFRIARNLAALSDYLLTISDMKEPFPVAALENGNAKVQIYDTKLLSGNATRNAILSYTESNQTRSV